jgi:hypothetical protein
MLNNLSTTVGSLMGTPALDGIRKKLVLENSEKRSEIIFGFTWSWETRFFC